MTTTHFWCFAHCVVVRAVQSVDSMSSTKKQRKVDARPDQDELELEKLLFGDNSSSLLSASNDGADFIPSDADDGREPKPSGEDSGEEGINEAARATKPAWHDEDDDGLEIDIVSSSRLRKLRSTKVDSTSEKSENSL